MVYSTFNRRINELFQKTMTNGVEAVMCAIGFYYFTKLNYDNKKHLIFDKNMAIMTFAITMAFLIRSSSLVGWIPLALAKIFSTSYVGMNLFSIITACVMVTIPTIIVSILIDSKFYGRLTVP